MVEESPEGPHGEGDHPRRVQVGGDEPAVRQDVRVEDEQRERQEARRRAVELPRPAEDQPSQRTAQAMVAYRPNSIVSRRRRSGPGSSAVAIFRGSALSAEKGILLSSNRFESKPRGRDRVPHARPRDGLPPLDDAAHGVRDDRHGRVRGQEVAARLGAEPAPVSVGPGRGRRARRGIGRHVRDVPPLGARGTGLDREGAVVEALGAEEVDIGKNPGDLPRELDAHREPHANVERVSSPCPRDRGEADRSPAGGPPV